MVKVFYWQWGKRVEHPEPFDDLDEAVSFLVEHGQPRHAGEIREFAPDEIADGERSITGRELDRLLDAASPW